MSRRRGTVWGGIAVQRAALGVEGNGELVRLPHALQGNVFHHLSAAGAEGPVCCCGVLILRPTQEGVAVSLVMILEGFTAVLPFATSWVAGAAPVPPFRSNATFNSFRCDGHIEWDGRLFYGWS